MRGKRMVEHVATGWFGDTSFTGGSWEGHPIDVSNWQFVLTSRVGLQFASWKVSKSGGWPIRLCNNRSIIAQGEDGA